MEEKTDLSGKNILLTGGGSGMGEATALALAKSGANVAIVGRRMATLTSTLAKVQPFGKILAKEADVTDRKSLDGLFIVTIVL